MAFNLGDYHLVFTEKVNGVSGILGLVKLFIESGFPQSRVDILDDVVLQSFLLDNFHKGVYENFLEDVFQRIRNVVTLEGPVQLIGSLYESRLGFDGRIGRSFHESVNFFFDITLQLGQQ